MAVGDFQEEFDVALTLIKEAGHIIKEAFYQAKNVTSKCEPSDLVTDTDKLVEKLLTEGLRNRFPNSEFIGEETTSDGASICLTDKPTWLIDPVDGTSNFVHKNPQVCTILGLLVNKTPVICLVYNPVLDQLWTARKGEGAFYNGTKMQVSGCRDLSKALLVLQMNPVISPSILSARLDNFATFLPLARSVRMTGSSGIDISYLAMGAVDAFFHFGHHIWDYGACTLLVEEAGGVSLDTLGGEVDMLARRVLVSASRELADQILPNITNIDMGREGTVE